MALQPTLGRRQRGSMMLPVIDSIVILGILIVGAITIMAQALRSMLPVVDYVNAHGDQLRAQVSGLSRLDRDHHYAPLPLDKIRDAIPTAVPKDLDVMRRLANAGGASAGNRAAMEDLERAGRAVWKGVLRGIADSERDFWSRRAAELCDGSPPVAPNLEEMSDPVGLALTLFELIDFRDAVWLRYQRCREPRTVVIDEELLHFRVDRADQFESDPRPAFRTIMRHVDENIVSHPRIYVIGHTDERASERYNDYLSFRRALHVADEIRKHLRARQLIEGRDYAVYPVGRGELQPVERVPGETTAQFWRRCRRIELSFRSAISGPGSEEGSS